jgi:Na+(H+)/acetate symporter ActP
MELQYWIWIAVGLSFSLYIGIAIWSRAASTKEFYVAGGGVHPIANGMATAATGCLLHHSFPWRVLYRLVDMMALYI